MKLSISKLIKRFGQENTRLYLLRRWSDEKYIHEFASLFTNQVRAPLPEHQWEIMRDVPKYARSAWAAPRGSGKSTLCDVIILAYYSLFHKAPFSVLLSDTETKARLLLGALKSELESNDALRWLFGDVRGGVWGNEMIELRTFFGESAIMARGAGQSIRGLKWRRFRPYLLLIDDLEDDEQVESQERREKLENWFRFSVLRGLNKSWSKIIYIGTILHEKALLGKIIAKGPGYGGWYTKKYKAIKDDGTSFWPELWPLEYLKAIRDDPTHPDYAGSVAFAQEMQNEPRSQSTKIINEGWLKYYNKTTKALEEGWLASLHIVAAIDPAISEKELSSDFVCHVFGFDKNGYKWHLDTIRGKFSALKQIELFFDLYQTWQPDLVGIETIAYQKALAQIIRAEGAKRNIYPHIKELYTDKSKVRRMEKSSAQFEGGFIMLDSTHPETPVLVNQLLSFPEEPNDSADCLNLVLETAGVKRGRAFRNKPAGM